MNAEQFKQQFKVGNSISCDHWNDTQRSGSEILSIHEFTFEAQDLKTKEVHREFFKKHKWFKV